MENEAQAPTQTPAQEPVGNKPKAYDPGNYTLIGLFLTLIPVFIMSSHNSKVFPNGEKIRKRMRIYMWTYILLIVGNLFLISWANYTVTKAILESPELVNLVFGLAPESIVESIPGVQLAITVLGTGNNLIFVIHILLLILTLWFTKKNEKPQFIELRAANQIDRKSSLVPSLIGLVISIGLFFYAIPGIQYLVQLLI